MDCKDFKEAIGADPRGDFEGAGHAADCVDCRCYADEMRALDARIARALTISVPPLRMPELPPLEESSNVVGLKPRRAIKAPVWLGLAASVLLAAFLGFRFLLPTEYPSLGAEILAHLDHEPGALAVTDRAVPEATLSRVLEKDVVGMDRGIGLVTYARTCVINGHDVPHLVIQGKRGPITLLLLPDEMIDAPVPLEGEGTEGVILPVGNGSIAIVGERGEALVDLEQRLENSVKWDRT